MKASPILLLSIFLIGMGFGAFAEAFASHDSSIGIELPSGSVVPLNSVVGAVEFKSIHVRGWAYNNSTKDQSLDVYYKLTSGNKSTDWKKALSMSLKAKERKEFEFKISNETVADFLSEVNDTEAVMDVLVSVTPKGEEPDVYVIAGSFAAIDAAKKLVEKAKEEELEANSDVVMEVAKELGVSTEQVKQLLKQSDGRAIRKYAEVKEKKRKQSWSGAPKYHYDPDKYIKMWCGGDSSCIQEVKEAIASGTPTKIPVKGYSVCGEITVGHELSYPRVICTKPGKKVLVKRALARAYARGEKASERQIARAYGVSEEEYQRAYARYRLASIYLQSMNLGFGLDYSVDVPSLTLGVVLTLVGVAVIGRLRGV